MPLSYKAAAVFLSGAVFHPQARPADVWFAANESRRRRPIGPQRLGWCHLEAQAKQAGIGWERLH